MKREGIIKRKREMDNANGRNGEGGMNGSLVHEGKGREEGKN